MDGSEKLDKGKTTLQKVLTDPRKSALNKYQEVVVGSSGFGFLLRYELLTCLVGHLPGAMGLMLRNKMYHFLLGHMGKGVVLGKSITIRHPNKVRIGDYVVIDDYAVLDAKGNNNAGIFIGNNVIIGRNTVLSCKNGDIYIGDNANIAMNSFIQSAKKVEIGNNVLLSAYCYIIGGGDHKTDRTDIPIIAQEQTVQGITVEDNCWIGAGAKVLDGVSIGRDSIVGAGAVVTKKMPAYVVAGGIPASVLRTRSKEWNLETLERGV